MTIIGPDANEIHNKFNLSNFDKNKLRLIKDKFKEYFAPKTFPLKYIFFKIEQIEYEQFNEFLTRVKIQAER